MFFFQAEDGIRDVAVTGVQTCALPIWIVGRMTSGVAGLFKKNKITWLQGHGKLVSGGTPWKIQIDSETVEAKDVVIATGSIPRHLPGVPVDNKVICDNEGALAFDSVPERLGVIGAGLVGLELGSGWRRLGSERSGERRGG